MQIRGPLAQPQFDNHEHRIPYSLLHTDKCMISMPLIKYHRSDQVQPACTSLAKHT